MRSGSVVNVFWICWYRLYQLLQIYKTHRTSKNTIVMCIYLTSSIRDNRTKFHSFSPDIYAQTTGCVSLLIEKIIFSENISHVTNACWFNINKICVCPLGTPEIILATTKVGPALVNHNSRKYFKLPQWSSTWKSSYIRQVIETSNFQIIFVLKKYQRSQGTSYQ